MSRADEAPLPENKSTLNSRLIHLLREGGYMPFSPCSLSALPRSGDNCTTIAAANLPQPR
jgi:hypothetical protein